MNPSAPRFPLSLAALTFALALTTTAWTCRGEESQPAFQPFPGSHPDSGAQPSSQAIIANPRLASLSRLTLPLDSSTTLEAIQTRLEVGEGGNFTWIGQLVGESLSEVVLVWHDGAFAGQIRRALEDGEVTYNIQPNTEGVSLLVSGEEAIPGGCETAQIPKARRSLLALEPAAAARLQAQSFPPATAANPAVVDVMAVYTPATAKKHGGKAGAESLIIGAIASANTGFRNSGVFVTLNLAYLGEVPYTEPNSTRTSLARLSTAGDGYLDEVPALRDAYGADLVILVSQDSDTCGTSYQMTTRDTTSAPWAYSVVFSGCISQYSMTHELAHTMGCDHDRQNTFGFAAYPYSFGHRVCTGNGKGYRTIMAYPCPGVTVPRINYFSNPNITFNGVPAGVPESDKANAADNAKSLNMTGHAVAAFRSRPLPPPAAPTQLSATALSPRSAKLVWIDNATDEQSFELERSLDGTTWTRIALLAANANQYTDASLAPGASYLYRLRASNGNGVSPWSSTASCLTPDPIPNTPSKLSIKSQGTGALLISWSDNSDNETGFEIYRASGTLTFNLIAVTGPNATSFLNSGLKSKTGYLYRIRAVGKSGASAWLGVAMGVSK